MLSLLILIGWIFDSTGTFKTSLGGPNKENYILNDARNLTVDPSNGKIYIFF